MAILARSRLLKKTVNYTIRTFTFLRQEAQLEEAPSPTLPQSEAPLPPNPNSTLYSEICLPKSLSVAQDLISLGYINQLPSKEEQVLSETLDLDSVKNLFAEWMISLQWDAIKEVFELWINSLDQFGKPNKPDIKLYNHYLRANMMSKASIDEMLDLVAIMEGYGIMPNTGSFNLVLKVMCEAREVDAAQKLLLRMLHTGRASQPDDESYDLVVDLLLSTDQIDAVLKSGYLLSVEVFTACVWCCVRKGKLDTLVSIIERCKKMDQNKALSPSWNLCNYIADVAIQEDNSALAYYALEFLTKWIDLGENASPPVLLSVDEAMVISALRTAARTYNSKLLDESWAILKRSLRQKKAPKAESYLAKISAYALLGNLFMALSTLQEFETTYANSTAVAEGDLFSPFSSLHPLVVACSKNGFLAPRALLSKQLKDMSRVGSPYISIAALNCIILACANTWDVNCAYNICKEFRATFRLRPNIHSYNALLHAFVKCSKTFQASTLVDYLSLEEGPKPDAKTYSLLVDAHLVNRDPKTALSVIDNMVNAGFVPSRETLKKVRRRCIREQYDEGDIKVECLAREFSIRMGTEHRRNMLFNLEYKSSTYRY